MAWSRKEVEATVSDYFEMLRAEIAGVPYSKARHRERLVRLLDGRSPTAVEFKHQNISAVLIERGSPYIAGYKPRSNYQALLAEVVSERLSMDQDLRELAAHDAERPIVIPEVEDILSVLRQPPTRRVETSRSSEAPPRRALVQVDYLEREARNRTLGAAGERFALNYERARLIHLGKEALAGKIEHISEQLGDGAGYDILSYEESGAPRLIEVKTTKYGDRTPFFVTKNELATSEAERDHYHLYRLYEFRASPEMFILRGAVSGTCSLDAASYRATVK